MIITIYKMNPIDYDYEAFFLYGSKKHNMWKVSYWRNIIYRVYDEPLEVILTNWNKRKPRTLESDIVITKHLMSLSRMWNDLIVATLIDFRLSGMDQRRHVDYKYRDRRNFPTAFEIVEDSVKKGYFDERFIEGFNLMLDPILDILVGHLNRGSSLLIDCIDTGAATWQEDRLHTMLIDIIDSASHIDYREAKLAVLSEWLRTKISGRYIVNK